MCYTGKCKYEDYYGDCYLKSINNLRGTNLDYIPDDAGCAIADKEIEKMEKVRIE
jgi:hypothetical protein